MFISFEGGDGAGKSTQIELLKEALIRQGEKVLVTREPGGCPMAEKIREILLDRSSVMDPLTEAYLYASARAEHVRTVIRPALEHGLVVLCDRYIDSSVAYQGFGRELGAERVENMNREAMEGCLPDRTYLLLLAESDAEKRVERRGERDRMESVGRSFERRVREGFVQIAKAHPERILVLDAGRSVQEIAAEITQDVAELKTKRLTNGI